MSMYRLREIDTNQAELRTVLAVHSVSVYNVMSRQTRSPSAKHTLVIRSDTSHRHSKWQSILARVDQWAVWVSKQGLLFRCCKLDRLKQLIGKSIMNGNRILACEW